MCPEFNYTAKDKMGKILSGIRSAESPLTIARELKTEGYHIEKINKVSDMEVEEKNKGQKLNYFKRITLSELIIFTDQFKIMIKSGIPIIESLQIIGEQTENLVIKKIIYNIQQHIEKGGGLSEALAKYPEFFPGLYCQLISAGERIGSLETVLDDLASHYKEHLKLKKEITGALYYPLIVLITALIAVVFLITFVVPGFVEIFNELNGNLPLPTKLVIKISNLLKNNIITISIISIITFISVFILSKTEKFRAYYQMFVFKIPFIGKVKKYSIIIRFSSTLSLLLENGLNLLDSLFITENIINNVVIKEIITDARFRVREGKQLSEIFYESNCFPLIMTKMMKAGEEAGALPDMLDAVSEFYENKLKESLETGITMIEPILIISMAFVVGFIAISVILPMFNMYSIF